MKSAPLMTLARILLVSLGEVGERAGHALGRALEPFAVGVRVDGAQDGRDVGLDLALGHGSGSNG